jgi:hypothetical protein
MSQSAQNFDSFNLDVIIRVFHAIKKHQEVLVPRNEGVKVGVETSKHRASYIDICVGRRSHEKLVKELVYLDFLLGVQFLFVLKLEAAERLHSLVSNLRILIEQVWEHALAHELQDVEIRFNLIEPEGVQGLERQDHHLHPLLLYFVKLGGRKLFLLFWILDTDAEVQEE